MSIPIGDIKEQFDKVISYSQYGIDNPKTDELFTNWATAKEYFYERFGNKYIWEYPEKITFELDEESKQGRVQDLINFAWSCGDAELARFLEAQKEGFFKNKVLKDYVTDFNEIITKNTKLVKAFKFFIKNQDRLELFQNRASQIIQENKIEGTLCLSIHPLDYLSISENDHNWRSCHSLDGQYRAGNLSYMMDSSTVVCYLKSENDTKLPHFPEDVPWNNKKWRVLLYFNNGKNLCFAGKQYPFPTNKAMDWIIDNCFEKIFTDSWNEQRWAYWTEVIGKYEDKKNKTKFFFNDYYVPFENAIKNLRDVVIDASGSKQFNDVLSSSTYHPIFTYLIRPSLWGEKGTNDCITNSFTRIRVGEQTNCLCCGKQETLLEGGTMMCYDCEYKYGNSDSSFFTNCECCGERVAVDDCYYTSNDEPVCEHCWNDYVKKCCNCNEEFKKEEMIYVEDTEEWFCKDCWESSKDWEDEY